MTELELFEKESRENAEFHRYQGTFYCVRDTRIVEERDAWREIAMRLYAEIRPFEVFGRTPIFDKVEEIARAGREKIG